MIYFDMQVKTVDRPTVGLLWVRRVQEQPSILILWVRVRGVSFFNNLKSLLLDALISGHKKWCLIHPSAPKQLVKPRKDESGKHPEEAVCWFDTVYKRVIDPSWYREYPAVHAVQGPGEVMFVPSGWWHVVMNLDNTVAVTQNFCSLSNLHLVW